MGIDKKLNPNWKQRIAEIGKNNFEVEEMIRLGFLRSMNLHKLSLMR